MATAEQVTSGAVAWARKFASDNTYGYKLWSSSTSSHQCPLCHPGSGNGWNCIGFVTAAYYHGGGLMPKRGWCSNSGIANDTWANKVTLQKWNNRNGPGWIEVTNGCRETHISSSRLKPGDVFLAFKNANGSSYYHTFMYVGNEEIADSSRAGSRANNIKVRKYGGSYKSNHYRVFRFVGSTDGLAPYEGVYYGPVSGEDDGSGIDMRQNISRLYSSDNYEYAFLEENNEETETQKLISRFRSDIQNAINNISFNPSRDNSGAIPEALVGPSLELTDFEREKPKKIISGKSTKLLSYPTLVEAPTIVLDFNGTKIGGYNNIGDKYPNYITSMEVNKINGRINTYTINLSYQVRFGEDPNFIDKLISKTGYRNPFKILYGDSNYPGAYYREESAIITDARQTEDSSAYRINYVITAVSSIISAQASYKTFKSKKTKPSTAIYDLLYHSGEISKSLQELFPGMSNENLIASKGLIPTTDEVVNIGGMENVSPLTYLSYLVACMNNPNSRSSYYLSLVDNSIDDLGGSYFKINEVEGYSNTNSNIDSSYFELDIGYPSDNFVMDFQVCNNDYWSLVYDYAGNISKFEYGIDDNGNLIETETNALYKVDKYTEGSLISSNWWSQVTEFPISAKVVLKGLMSPALLMSYIKVNALFYGLRDLASGLYVVTAQRDSVSGSGYTTELTLLRVAGE